MMLAPTPEYRSDPNITKTIFGISWDIMGYYGRQRVYSCIFWVNKLFSFDRTENPWRTKNVYKVLLETKLRPALGRPSGGKMTIRRHWTVV